MQLFENISLAVAGLRANKMRALLTMLGIIIGIGSVITIVTVGDAMTNSVTAVFNDMGANSFQLFLSDKPDENGALNYNRSYEAEDYLNDDILSLYTERFADEIENWAVTVNAGNGRRRWAAARPTHGFTASTPMPWASRTSPRSAGHDLNDREVSGEKYVAVVSKGMLEKLMPGVSPQQALGQEIKVRLTAGLYTLQRRGGL